MIRAWDQDDSAWAIGEFLRRVRETHRLKRSVVAAALDMGEQNIRYYEAGRNRLAAEDIPRFADAYAMSTSEREQFAKMLGLLSDAPELTEEEEADLERLAPREKRILFAVARDYTNASPDVQRDRLAILKALAGEEYREPFDE